MNTLGPSERATPNRVLLNRKAKFRRRRPGQREGLWPRGVLCLREASPRYAVTSPRVYYRSRVQDRQVRLARRCVDKHRRTFHFITARTSIC